MITNYNNLVAKDVETRTGIPLGKIVDCHLETNGHMVKKYVVQQRRFLTKGPELLISPDQIIEINDDIIVVDDSLIADDVKEREQEFISQEERIKGGLTVKNPVSVNSEMSLKK